MTTTGKYNIHAALHGLFHWYFLYSYSKQTLILSNVLWPSDCAMFYYTFDAQSFLLPQRVPHREP